MIKFLAIALIALQIASLTEAKWLRCGHKYYNSKSHSCCLNNVIKYPNAKPCGASKCYNPATDVCKHELVNFFFIAYTRKTLLIPI
jgi:hypothetical protein